jgi:hypothetical protein
MRGLLDDHDTEIDHMGDTSQSSRRIISAYLTRAAGITLPKSQPPIISDAM